MEHELFSLTSPPQRGNSSNGAAELKAPQTQPALRKQARATGEGSARGEHGTEHCRGLLPPTTASPPRSREQGEKPGLLWEGVGQPGQPGTGLRKPDGACPVLDTSLGWGEACRPVRCPTGGGGCLGAAAGRDRETGTSQQSVPGVLSRSRWASTPACPHARTPTAAHQGPRLRCQPIPAGWGGGRGARPPEPSVRKMHSKTAAKGLRTGDSGSRSETAASEVLGESHPSTQARETPRLKKAGEGRLVAGKHSPERSLR